MMTKSPSDAARDGKFLGTKLGDRQVTELIGVARGLVADGELNDSEIEFLHRWLVSNTAAHTNPMIGVLLERIRDIYLDGYIDEDERASLTDVLVSLSGNDFEIGEVLKTTDLPVTNPAPNIDFAEKKFCFTGTFTYGRRSACEAAVVQFGATHSNVVSRGTDYLVIGAYATAAWKQSSFGRKIEQALQFRSEGYPIAIVAEYHWRDYI